MATAGPVACALILAGCATGVQPVTPTEPAAPAAAPAAAPLSPVPAATATGYPLTIDNCGQQVTFTEPPSRVVILNGASVAEVESLLTLGLGDRILANSQSYGVSEDPTMVEEVAAVPTGGLTLNSNYEVPAEQILNLRPDLVISTWSGGFNPDTGGASREQLTASGINSYVTPVNCANGAASPRPDDQAAYTAQSVQSSYDMLLELGVIFDVQQRAVDHVTRARADLARVQQEAAGRPVRSVLVAFPGMAAAMSTNGVPAIFGGGITDDIIARAGGTNPFAGFTNDQLAQINVEALAAADVDVLVIGLFQPGENAQLMAEDLFAQFPDWEASTTRTWTSVSDSIYLGPFNALAVERIAGAGGN